MSVNYEWVVEVTTTDDTPDHGPGEVTDHYFAMSYADAARFAASEPDVGCEHVVVLVRDDAAGRAWAYLQRGALPAIFSDAFGRQVAKVPTRFVREIARAVQS